MPAVVGPGLLTFALTCIAVIAGLSAKTVDGASVFSDTADLPGVHQPVSVPPSMPVWSPGPPRTRVTSIVKIIRAGSRRNWWAAIS